MRAAVTTASIAHLITRETERSCVSSTCRAPDFQTRCSSSIRHRLVYPSRISETSWFVAIGRLVSRRQCTGFSPRGVVPTSRTSTTLIGSFKPLVAMTLDHVEGHSGRTDPKLRDPAPAIKSRGQVERRHAAKLPLARRILQTPPWTAPVRHHEAMAVGRPHGKPLAGAMKRRQRPIAVGLPIDLKPRARAGKHQRSRGLPDRAHPVQRLLLLERPLSPVASLLVRLPRPPLLIEHAQRRAVGRERIRVDHLQASRSVERGAHGSEVLLPLPVRQLEARAVHDHVDPPIPRTTSQGGCLHRGEHRLPRHLGVAQQVVGPLLLCVATKHPQDLAARPLGQPLGHTNQTGGPTRIPQLRMPELLVPPLSDRSAFLSHPRQTTADAPKFPRFIDL